MSHFFLSPTFFVFFVCGARRGSDDDDVNGTRCVTPNGTQGQRFVLFVNQAGNVMRVRTQQAYSQNETENVRLGLGLRKIIDGGAA